MEPGETPSVCALRETWEELGIPPERVRVFGEADFLHLRSEGLMRPVVGLLPPLSMADLTLNPQEVSRVFTVPVDWLIAHPPELYRYTLRPEVGSDFPYDAVRTPADYTWTPGIKYDPRMIPQREKMWNDADLNCMDCVLRTVLKMNKESANAS